MLAPDAIAAAARTSLEMHRTRTRYRPFDAGLRAAPLDDAYRIQDALHRLMAEAGRGEIVGWKIALTSKAMQQMTGVDQPAAGVHARHRRHRFLERAPRLRDDAARAAPGRPASAASSP